MMSARGWILWRYDRKSGRSSYVCEAVGCRSTVVVPDSDVASGVLHDRCRARHHKSGAGGNSFSAAVVKSHADLQVHLRNRRLRLGLSQDDVEAAAGMAVDHIAKLETSRRLPQFPTYFAWAEALGYDIVLVPKALPSQLVAIIDHKAGRPVPERRPPACLLLPSDPSGARSRPALRDTG